MLDWSASGGFSGSFEKKAIREGNYKDYFKAPEPETLKTQR